MPAGAVSWLKLDIMCFCFSFRYWGTRGRPWGETPRVAYMSRSLVSYRPLAIARRGAREKPCGRDIARNHWIWRAHSFKLAALPFLASLRRQ